MSKLDVYLSELDRGHTLRPEAKRRIKDLLKGVVFQSSEPGGEIELRSLEEIKEGIGEL